MDETHKIAITRLGDRIRVGGMAEITSFDMSLNAKRQATLTHSVEDLFGGAGNQSKATFWCGLRPMTPDGTPIVGRSPIANLFLNTGHGTLGWTMAAGLGGFWPISSRAVAPGSKRGTSATPATCAKAARAATCNRALPFRPDRGGRRADEGFAVRGKGVVTAALALAALSTWRCTGRCSGQCTVI